MPNLSSSAQKIQDQIKSLGYDYTVIEHAESTRTAQEAADRAGCELGQIVKSLIFRGRRTDRVVLVTASGANRVDEERVARLVDEPIEKADAAFVRARTGFAIGGVAPVGSTGPLTTVIDEDLLQWDEIWAAAGHPKTVFRLSPGDLVRMTGGRVALVRA